MALRFLSALILLVVLVSTRGPSASAQSCTHWLNASDGNDSNPGTLTQPVRSIEAAYRAFPDGSTICTAGGEYFYGADADGIQFDIPGKSITFRMQSFAGAGEVRISEQEMLIDAGSGVISFLNDSATSLVLGSGVVNANDPAKPSLLNFLHTIALVSGTLDVSGLPLTLEAPVGDPNWVNPVNPDKSAPSNAGIVQRDGSFSGTIDWTLGTRQFIVSPSEGSSESTFELFPPDLAGQTVLFSGDGSALVASDLDLTSTSVAFEGSGTVRFEGEVSVDASRGFDFDENANGHVRFEHRLLLSNAGDNVAEWALPGSTDLFISELIAVGIRPTEPGISLLWLSEGEFRIEQFLGEAEPGNATPEISITNSQGTLLLGPSGGTTTLPGPVFNQSTMTLSGDVELSSGPAPLRNDGSLDLAGFDLAFQGASDQRLENDGTIISTVEGGSLTVGVPLTINGSGSITPILNVTSPVTLSVHRVLGGMILTAGGGLSILAGGEVTSGLIDLGSGAELEVGDDATLTTNDGLLLRAGSDVGLGARSTITVDGDVRWEAGIVSTLPSGVLSTDPDAPSLTVRGANRIVHFGTTENLPSLLLSSAMVAVGGDSPAEFPGIRLEESSLVWSSASSPAFVGDIELSGSSLEVSTPGDLTLSGNLSLVSGSSARLDAFRIVSGGDWNSRGSSLDLVGSSVTPSDGSTLHWLSDTPIVLPALLLDDTGASISLTSNVILNSSLDLSSGEILIENGYSLRLRGDLQRSSGNFEPIDGGWLILDGTTPQAVSGFESSVLPSIRIDGAPVSIQGSATILGDLAQDEGNLSLSDGSTVQISGNVTQSGGSMTVTGSSDLAINGSWTVDTASFSSGAGTVTVGGDINLLPSTMLAQSTTLHLVSDEPQSLVLGAGVSWGILHARAPVVTLSGETLRLASALQIDAGTAFQLDGIDLVMETPSGATAINNEGSIVASGGWIRFEGSHNAFLTGNGHFGGLRVDLANDESSVVYNDPGDVFHVSDDIWTVSGGLEIGSRAVSYAGIEEPPSLAIDLSDVVNAPGLPDGRGILSNGTAASVASTAEYDLVYTGDITSLVSIGDEFRSEAVRDLTIDTSDPVNSPPIFGMRLSGTSSVSGAVLVSDNAVLRIDNGTLILAGDSKTHAFNGTVSGSGALRLTGMGSAMLRSGSGEGSINALEIALPNESVSSTLFDQSRIGSLTMLSGSLLLDGRDLEIGTMARFIGGLTTLRTHLLLSEDAMMEGSDARLQLDTGSGIDMGSGGSLLFSETMQVVVAEDVAAADETQDARFVFNGSGSLAAPAGIPRIIIDAISGTESSDNIVLTDDLAVSEWLDLRNGDLFAGVHDITISGGSLLVDSDGSSPESDGDAISGDFSGQEGVLRFTGSVDVILGSDVEFPSIDLEVDAGGGTVRLESMDDVAHSLTLANRPFRLTSGSLDLGKQKLVLNGSSNRVLDIVQGSVIASSTPSSLPGALPETLGEVFNPFLDSDFGELVIRGGGSASIHAVSPTTIPNLRVFNSIRVDEGSSELTIGNRLVFGRTGASIILEENTSLAVADGATLVRRGRGTFSKAPRFVGSVSVAYDLDDGSVTGNGTGFEQGDLLTGLEIPQEVGKLENLLILAGNRSNTINRVLLASDTQVGSSVVVWSGTLHTNGKQLLLDEGALLAIDQIDGSARGALTGGSPESTGPVSLSMAARYSNVGVTSTLLGSLTLSDVNFHAGRSGSIVARTFRLGSELTAATVTVEGINPGDALRLEGNDLAVSESVQLFAAELTSSQLVNVYADRLDVDDQSSLSGPINAVVGGDVHLDGAFDALELRIGGDFTGGAGMGTGAVLTFAGSDQLWSLDANVSVSALRMDQSGDTARVRLQTDAPGPRVTVSNSLQLVNGLLDNSDVPLALEGSGDGFTHSVAQGRLSHVTGSVIREVGEGLQAPVSFPVGSESAYRPLTLDFNTPLLSATTLTAGFRTSSSASRYGLPLTSADGKMLVDATAFYWTLSSSVNFAQSQPLDLTLRLDETLAGPASGHRMIQRNSGATISPWTSLSGTAINTESESSFLVRSLGARGILRPQGVEIGVGLSEALYDGELAVQFADFGAQTGSRFTLDGTPRFQSSNSTRVSRFQRVGFDSAASTLLIGGLAPGSGATSVGLSIDPSSSPFKALVRTDSDGNERVLDLSLSAGSAPTAGAVRVWLVHARLDLGDFTLSTYDIDLPVILAPGLAAGEATGSFLLPATVHRFLVADDFDLQETFRIDLSALDGKDAVLYLTKSALNGAQNDVQLIAAGDGLVLEGALVTGLDSNVEPLPADFAIRGNYPNPFSGTTRLLLDLPESAEVSFELFDILGRRVMHGQSGMVSAGASQEITVDGSRLASGTYLVAVTARGASKPYRATRTMLVVR